MTKPISLSNLIAILPWIIAAVILALLPILFPAPSTVTIMNQMAITIVFALSYNMLLGQAGMLSFGHAIYMGLGGFACIHLIKATGDIPLPLPFLPLLAGLFSLGIATIIGAFSTHRSGTLFAMISLGIIELTASLAIIVSVFFGYGGASGDRTLAPTFFGVDFAQQIEVYYLIAGWCLTSTAMMYLFTQTPIGRLANAVRDNPERAEFIGYSARLMRFYSFCGAGFFAGVAGGLSAINFEIATAENLNLAASGTILMIAFLGGTGFFFGPILGAILFTFLQTVLSLHSELWQLYLGILFVATVMFFPSGLAGLLMAHAEAIKRGQAIGLAKPYIKTLLFGILTILAFASLFEMLHAHRNAPTGETATTLLWTQIDTASPLPWLIAICAAAIGLWRTKSSAKDLSKLWPNA